MITPVTPVGLTPIMYTTEEGGLWKSWGREEIVAVTLGDSKSCEVLVDFRGGGTVVGVVAMVFAAGHGEVPWVWESRTGWRNMY